MQFNFYRLNLIISSLLTKLLQLSPFKYQIIKLLKETTNMFSTHTLILHKNTKRELLKVPKEWGREKCTAAGVNRRQKEYAKNINVTPSSTEKENVDMMDWEYNRMALSVWITEHVQLRFKQKSKTNPSIWRR